MDQAMTVVGYAVTMIFIASLAWAVLHLTVDVGGITGNGGPNGNDGFILRVLGFGFVYARQGTQLQGNLNKMRKTENKRWFFTAPTWFNKHVVNWGGIKGE
jgi:hypothetical protein